MKLHELIISLAAGEITDNVFVACDEYVAQIINWATHKNVDGDVCVYARVVSIYGELPFLPEEDSRLQHSVGDVVEWYLDTDDDYYTDLKKAKMAAMEEVYTSLRNREIAEAKEEIELSF